MRLMKFESFIESEYLYHTTHIVYVNSILYDDRLRVSLTSDNACTRDFKCISLTRDEHFFYDNQPFRFKLNKRKLLSDYDIEPYIDPIFDGEDLESEEVIKEDIKPLHEYIESIQFDPNQYYEDDEIELIYNNLKDYIEKYHLSFEIKIKGEFVESEVESILEIKKYI